MYLYSRKIQGGIQLVSAYARGGPKRRRTQATNPVWAGVALRPRGAWLHVSGASAVSSPAGLPCRDGVSSPSKSSNAPS